MNCGDVIVDPLLALALPLRLFVRLLLLKLIGIFAGRLGDDVVGGDINDDGDANDGDDDAATAVVDDFNKFEKDEKELLLSIGGGLPGKPSCCKFGDVVLLLKLIRLLLYAGGCC